LAKRVKAPASGVLSAGERTTAASFERGVTLLSGSLFGIVVLGCPEIRVSGQIYYQYFQEDHNAIAAYKRKF
jgi:hypothetical protein